MTFPPRQQAHRTRGAELRELPELETEPTGL